MSDDRSEVNRRNAMRSTGPRTSRGKRRVANNAVKHGLLTRNVLAPGERRGDFARFRKAMMDALTPVGELEDLLADRVVSSAWRLRRLLRVETAHLWTEQIDYMGEIGDEGDAFVSFAVNGETIGKFSRYEAAIDRALFRALHELQRLQAVRLGERVPAPVAVDVTVSGNLNSSSDKEGF